MINNYIWLVCFVSWGIIISSIKGQAASIFFYDATSCREDGKTRPGTRYSCGSSSNINNSCETFLVFRANRRFPTISAISTLFGPSAPPIDTLLQLNNINSALETLFEDREVFVPITCYCGSSSSSGNNYFFETRIFNYSTINIENSTATLSDIACSVFQGLVKKITLLEEINSINQQEDIILKVGFVLNNLPLKCACLSANNISSDYKYLVTYPLVSGDSITKISRKFDVSSDEILAINNLQRDTTVYPETTILVPFRSKPMIDFEIVPNSFQPPTPTGFLPTKPVELGNIRSTKLKKVYIVVSIIGFGLVLGMLFVTALYIKTLNKCKLDIIDFVIPSHRNSSFSTHQVSLSSPRSRPSPVVVTRSSSPSSSCLSPDLLAGIKYSLCNFAIEELKRVTNGFSEDCKVSKNSYRGSLILDIDDGDDAQEVVVLIKEIEFSEIPKAIDLHSKINHVNILKLVGVCYNNNNNDDDDHERYSSCSYIVLEYPAHGSLRDCLIKSSSSLSWHRRTQIAFDVAMGLHYLHCCIIIPPHHSRRRQTKLGSENIFVTSKWRAKLAVSSCSNDPAPVMMTSSSSYSGMEYYDGEKEDIMEFGMVLLEILSGKVDDRKCLHESIGFLGEDSEGGGCFGNLRRFMDPCLKKEEHEEEEDYPLAEALCLGVLAKACVANDPLHRPSFQDVLKVLARLIN